MNATFSQALSRFATNLTPDEEADFRFTSLEDVHRVTLEIQHRQGTRREMMNLTHIQAFLEGMD